jgi:hypothetical protein
MKTVSLCFLVSVISFLPAVCVTAAPPELRVSVQELAVSIDPASHRMRGVSTLVIPAGTGGKVLLSLAPRATVSTVTRDGFPVAFSFRDGQLDIPVTPLKEKGTARVVISYECVYGDPLPEQFRNSEEASFGISGVISPQGTFLGESAGWYPRPAAPVSRFTVTVTTPAGIEAITAGKRVTWSTAGGDVVSTWEIREPLPAIALSAGPYRIAERDADGIPVYTYLYPGNEQLADRYLTASVKYLREYGKLFGPYPFPKFAVVENFFPSGYGYPSYTLIGGTVLRLPFIVTSSLPHEIAHNWWGNGVLVDESGGNWCEGLVSYLADYYQETGDLKTEGAGYRFRLLAEFASAVPPERDFPLRLFTRRVDAASRAVGYGKGAMLFHMVRSMIGDRVFYAALRRVMAKSLFREASWGDFIAAFSAEAGRDMTPFISPWVERAGGARLMFSDVGIERVASGWRVSGVVAQREPGYTLPLTIRVETATDQRDDRIMVQGGRTPFALLVPDLPKRLLLDPEFELFRLLDRREIPKTVARIKGSQSLRAVITKGCRSDEATLRQLLVSLGQESTPILREEETIMGDMKGHDFLYCGVPASRGALPPLPPGVTLASRYFAVDHERFDQPGHALFMVLDDPDDSDRVVALFNPLSPEAATASVHKIAHYNKFGYLVFDAGVNRAKGTVVPPGGGGVVQF